MKTIILITGIGAAGVGEQILKSLKYSKLDLFIIGTDITEICFNKELVDKFIILPPVSDNYSYEFKLKELIKEYNVEAIFPGSEVELKYFINNRNKYNELLISINSTEIIDLCLNKFNTYEKFKELKINIPKYQKINNIEDCKNINFFPVVLKPNTNSGGSSHIYVAFNYEETKMFSKYMLDHYIDIIAQHYVGDRDSEYTIGVSSDNSGKINGSIILRRNLTNGLSVSKRIKHRDGNVVISSGISQGEFIHNEELKRQAEEIAYKLKSKGPMNIQGRLVNGKLLIFEINPRLSGTTYLRALVGYNEPENMIKSYILNDEVRYDYEDKTVLRSIKEEVF